MNHTLENEYKILISYDKYKNLKNEIVWDKSFKQINYYYDTPELKFYESDTTVRIRECLGEIMLQVKYPDISNECYKSRIEKEFEIFKIPIFFSSDEIRRYIPDLVIKDFVLQLGSLETIRKEKKINDNITLFLDYNTYLDSTDYEVEIEFGKYSPTIQDILNELHLNVQKVNGKYKRFIIKYKLDMGGRSKH